MNEIFKKVYVIVWLLYLCDSRLLTHCRLMSVYICTCTCKSPWVIEYGYANDHNIDTLVFLNCILKMIGSRILWHLIHTHSYIYIYIYIYVYSDVPQIWILQFTKVNIYYFHKRKCTGVIILGSIGGSLWDIKQLL